MCLLKKNAVIFKVGNNIEDPIVVIQQKIFTHEEPDSCVPILGIYDGTHYQSVFPASKKDEELTEDIVKYFPEFQGNFKAFFKDKTNRQKDILKCHYDGPNSSYEEGPVSGQEHFKIDGLRSSYAELVSEQKNSAVDEPNSIEEGTAYEQENSKIDGSYEEFASKQENSEIDELISIDEVTVSEHELNSIDEVTVSEHELNSIDEVTVSEQENSKIDGSYEEFASEQENSEIDELNSIQERTASEEENSKIIFDAPFTEKENSEIDGRNSSYIESDSEKEYSEVGGPKSSFEGPTSYEKNAESQENFKGFVENKHLEKETMLFMTMQEKNDKKLKKRMRQRIRAQVICLIIVFCYSGFLFGCLKNYTFL